MSNPISLTVAILLENPTDTPQLLQTLESIPWVPEILIADAFGVSLQTLSKRFNFIHLPLVHMPPSLIQHHCVVSSSQAWILFLKPGEMCSEIFLQALIPLLNRDDSDSKSYVFPRKMVWKDLSWMEETNLSSPDLFKRHDFDSLHHGPVYPMPDALTYSLSPTRLFPWLLSQATQSANQRIENEGLKTLASKMPLSWIQEILAVGLGEGVFKGQLFKDKNQRLSLFIRLLKIHLQWFKLYSYL